MRSACLLTLALAATAAAHKDHDGLRGGTFDKKHSGWMEKYVTWLKQSLLEQNVQLTGEIFSRSSVPGRSVIAQVVGNSIKVTCKSEQGAASTDKVALALRYSDRFVYAACLSLRPTSTLTSIFDIRSFAAKNDRQQ